MKKSSVNSNMKKVWVQYSEENVEIYECESYGWDRNFLFLNGCDAKHPDLGPMKVTISLHNIMSWATEETGHDDRPTYNS